jgi:hypothetical protein
VRRPDTADHADGMPSGGDQTATRRPPPAPPAIDLLPARAASENRHRSQDPVDSNPSKRPSFHNAPAGFERGEPAAARRLTRGLDFTDAGWLPTELTSLALRLRPDGRPDVHVVRWLPSSHVGAARRKLDCGSRPGLRRAGRCRCAWLDEGEPRASDPGCPDGRGFLGSWMNAGLFGCAAGLGFWGFGGFVEGDPPQVEGLAGGSAVGRCR